MPKRKHSDIWNHFCEVPEKKAKCKYCSVTLSIAGGSVGNLNRHLNVKHPLVQIELQRQPQSSILENPSTSQATASNPTSSTEASLPQPPPYNRQSNQPQITAFVRKPLPISKMQQIDNQVAKMIAKGHHALRIVEEPEFKKLIEIVSHCPGYRLPTRKTLTYNILPKIYSELRSKVLSKLMAASAVCLTTDGWTSRTNKPYIAVTAHFIDTSSGELSSALLDCKEYSDKHSSVNLQQVLKEVATEWQISDKIVAAVSDNAANIVSAIRSIQWSHIGCFAHILNLVVQKATQEIISTIEKVKSVVEYFNRSSQGAKKLREAQRQMNLPELKLKQDVPTRWNSTYDMLERILRAKDAIITTVALLKNDLALTTEDWDIIEESLPVLKPFYEVTVEISAEKNVTLSKVIVFVKLLQSTLAKTSTLNEKTTALRFALQTGMEKRFHNIELSILYAECTILDPRFKQKGFKNRSSYESALLALRRKLQSVVLPVDEAEINSIVSHIEDDLADTGGTSIWNDYDQDIKNIKRPESNDAEAIIELDKYINEDYLDRKSDPLLWWVDRKNIYPRLYTFILKRFCIVATSVPCERIFSAAAQIISERRTLISSDHASMLLFLHSNM